MSYHDKQKNIAIIGAGSWGSALAKVASLVHKVKIWSCLEEEIKMLNENREHIYKLPGCKFSSNVEFSTDIEYVLHSADLILVAVPSQAVRQTCRMFSKYMIDRKVPIVCCSKGLEDESCLRLTQVIQEEINDARIAVLSGPSHAEEVGMGIPTVVVAASNDIDTAEYVQNTLMSSVFRIYTRTDVAGVEIGAAIKNVIAICAGISDGLGFGDNTRAALLTRGLTEITRLGVVMGGDALTFFGLTGLGDLIVTCDSVHSRNRKAGMLIGQGYSVNQAIDEVKMVVEGVTTTKAAYKLCIEKGVNMPITLQAYEVLFKNKKPLEAVQDLMCRDKRTEIEYFE